MRQKMFNCLLLLRTRDGAGKTSGYTRSMPAGILLNKRNEDVTKRLDTLAPHMTSGKQWPPSSSSQHPLHLPISCPPLQKREAALARELEEFGELLANIKDGEEDSEKKMEDEEGKSKRERIIESRLIRV